MKASLKAQFQKMLITNIKNTEIQFIPTLCRIPCCDITHIQCLIIDDTAFYRGHDNDDKDEDYDDDGRF